MLERVVGDHVLLRIRTGALRTIPWREIDLYPPHPTRRLADVETVHTSQGNEFHGDVIERVFQHHIVLQLPSGDLKSIAWDDLVFPSERKRPYEDEDWDANAKRAGNKPQAVTARSQDAVDENPTSFAAGVCVGAGFSLLLTGVPLVALGVGDNIGGFSGVGGMIAVVGLTLVVVGFAYNAAVSARHRHRLSLVDQ